MYKRPYLSTRGCNPELLCLIICYCTAFNAFHTGKKSLFFKDLIRLEKLRVGIFLNQYQHLFLKSSMPKFSDIIASFHCEHQMLIF